MDIFENLIPLLIIVSIVFSIIGKAKKVQGKSSNNSSATASSSSQNKVQSLQDIIRQQIEEQKNAVKPVPPKTTHPAFQHKSPKQPNQPPKPTTFGEGQIREFSSLENTPVEMQRHSHNAHGGRPSYNEGDPLNRKSLEGQPNILDVASLVTRRGKKATKNNKQALSKSGNINFKINTESVVNGIIMSEILNKRGGRRTLK